MAPECGIATRSARPRGFDVPLAAVDQAPFLGSVEVGPASVYAGNEQWINRQLWLVAHIARRTIALARSIALAFAIAGNCRMSFRAPGRAREPPLVSRIPHPRRRHRHKKNKGEGDMSHLQAPALVAQPRPNPAIDLTIGEQHLLGNTRSL